MKIRRVLILFTMLGFSTVFAQADPLKDQFVLDGIRLIKELHKDSGVSVFSNNGVRGIGLTLSFKGKLGSKVLDAYNLNIDKVVLSDNTTLSSKQIRTKSAGSYKDGWGIELSNDRSSVGIQVDLVYNKLSNFKLISGSFMVSKPMGEVNILSDILKDKKQSKESKVGIEVEMCMNWGMGGRYILLKLANADKIQNVKVLDENGNELNQTTPFNVISDNNLKLYVKKNESDSFKVSLNLAKEIVEEKIPFVIHNVKLIK